jgi:hypothetical protein
LTVAHQHHHEGAKVVPILCQGRTARNSQSITLTARKGIDVGRVIPAALPTRVFRI